MNFIATVFDAINMLRTYVGELCLLDTARFSSCNFIVKHYLILQLINRTLMDVTHLEGSVIQRGIQIICRELSKFSPKLEPKNANIAVSPQFPV